MRCVNPNTKKAPGLIEPRVLLHQLRCSGLMAAVRISRAGFPCRLPRESFFARFACLSGAATHAGEAQFLEGLAGRAGLSSLSIAVGKTKVFLKAHAADALEALRSRLLTSAAITLQTRTRAFLARAAFLSVASACATLARVGRGLLARRCARNLRRERAADIIMRHARSFALRKKARRVERERTAARALGAAWRGRVSRVQYARVRARVVAVQCVARRRGAVTRARALRVAWRDAGRMREEANELRREGARLKEENAALQRELRRVQVSVERPTCHVLSGSCCLV